MCLVLCMASCTKEEPGEVNYTPEVIECPGCGGAVIKNFSTYTESPYKGYVCPTCSLVIKNEN